MPLAEPSFSDHLFQILHDCFKRPPAFPGKLLDITVFPVIYNLNIFPKPSYRTHHIGSGQGHGNKSDAECSEYCHTKLQYQIPSCRCRSKRKKQNEKNRSRRKKISRHRQKHSPDLCGSSFQIQKLLRRLYRMFICRLFSGRFPGIVIPSGVPVSPVHISGRLTSPASFHRILPVPASVLHSPCHIIHGSAYCV